jgi:hypothetical protein
LHYTQDSSAALLLLQPFCAMMLLAFKRTTYKLERGHDEARRRRRYAAAAYAAAAAAAGLGDAPLSAVKEVEMLKPNARRSPGYVTNALYFNLRVLALHLVRLVVELREDGGEASVGGRPVRVLGRELERAKRLVAPDLDLRDPRHEPACAVRARCVRGACAVRARCVRGACAVRARCVRGACARPACDVRSVACERV